jgi:hypothetical protein
MTRGKRIKPAAAAFEVQIQERRAGCERHLREESKNGCQRSTNGLQRRRIKDSLKGTQPETAAAASVDRKIAVGTVRV